MQRTKQGLTHSKFSKSDDKESLLHKLSLSTTKFVQRSEALDCFYLWNPIFIKGYCFVPIENKKKTKMLPDSDVLEDD